MKRILAIGSVLILLFTGCAKTKEEKAIRIKDDNVSLRLEGMAYPSQKYAVISQVDGKIEDVYVYDGYKVKKGDLIAKIENKFLDLEIEKLKKEINALKSELSAVDKNRVNAELIRLAKEQMKKMERLKNEGYVSEMEYNNYKKSYLESLKNMQNNSINTIATIEDKQIQLQKLLLKKEKEKITAPIDGFVANLKVQKGSLVIPGQKICDVLDIDYITVRAGLPPGLLPFVKVGQKVRIDFITEPQYSTYATISKINPIVDDKFQNMTLEIKVKNKDYLIQPQTRALVLIYLSKKDQPKVKKLMESKGGIIQIPSDI